jgi:hypothetical protein
MSFKWAAPDDYVENKITQVVDTIHLTYFVEPNVSPQFRIFRKSAILY